MNDPYYDPIESAEGVQATVDLNGQPVSTGQLLSRVEIDPEELEHRVPKQIIRVDPLKTYVQSFERSGVDAPFVPEVQEDDSVSREPSKDSDK